MGKGYCQHGCYPVDSRWHSGLKSEDGFEINSIFDLRQFIIEHGGGMQGAEAAEELIVEQRPSSEPYVLPSPGEQDSIERKKLGRAISISNEGQGFDYGAHLGIIDHLSTYYRYEHPSPIKVREWINSTPGSQIHDEMVQRKQQAEQQINRILSNLQDLYEQKQLLEHDRRKLEERMAHFEAGEDERSSGGGFEDELKADFVDLVDQHTGRHSILQMQSNNVFPSITADFYQMSGLEDLQEGGQLADLPENEKAVLRKKWKLYKKWKDQFRTAVESKLADVNRRLNSVQTSIEQTEEWIKPYVEDIKRIHPDEDTFEERLETYHGFSGYMWGGYSNYMRGSKIISAMDRSPGEHQNQYYDVLIFTPLQATTPGFEQPQAAGQGLVIYKIQFTELLCCKHVFDEVFQPQIDQKKKETRNYIKKFVGEGVDIGDEKEKIQEKYSEVLTDDEAERIEEAASAEELQLIESEINERLGSRWRRWRDRVRGFFGLSDESHHDDPQRLRRELLGPYFPTQFYLDYKYDNDLYVMK